ncbi:bifunctional adenosylcobinamide kinase/adenosylcobinamide-phosphate guanylyltransferase [Geomonas nitrogeniifigens]|uniref:bifunctional adenosylcobinamide kinase/adenosylcobinamide-phosphate guanylyltransferase n=1 Tax=Geomonas diazotrophica TaxID=2843197 RepID=UPI001C2C5EA5|nr:bifunctional adenosylcobinamide kinase/adenosylcobinamide-phosphate guanylyltransferase [Geomonas nitrogeniifigens]QXE86276.1 bifunctional adenosylcobinamide kinase/adenosylcobinamide-phosphate guanylyltransferase [Geomonas nitrogeniifigens]
MSRVVLVTGGARSGKSRFAEGLAEKYAPLRGYLATGEAGDAEMTQRIARHQGRRGPEWQTVEEPLRVAEAIRAHEARFNVMLLDCVTLWISNLLFRCPGGAAEALAQVVSFAGGFGSLTTPLVIVTNEVGMGIVPEHLLSRSFRDLAGEANEIIAAAADEVYVTISGLPLRLK